MCWSVHLLVRQPKLHLWLLSQLARFVTMQALIGAAVLQGSGHAQSGMGPLRDSVSVYRALVHLEAGSKVVRSLSSVAGARLTKWSLPR
jgi:hypothetical protein